MNGLVSLLRIGGVARVAANFSGPSLSIVMMHRFSPAGEGRAFHDVKKLRADLSLLRKTGVELVDLDKALSEGFEQFTTTDGKRLAKNRKPRVVFTVDDGYSDAVEIAGPAFAEFDCPVTCFVAPYIVEKKEWYWWDKVDYIIKHSESESLEIHLANGNLSYPVTSQSERRKAYDAICSLIKRLPSSHVSPLISQLAKKASVTFPAHAPAEYSTLSWSDIRKAESAGWRFGPHSMTHPLLSRCEDDQAQWEITESIAVLRRETHQPSNVFCYPVGQKVDFGEREVKIVQGAGLRFALSAIPGGLKWGSAILNDPAWQYKVPRFSHDDRPGGIIRMLLD